jgi:hypothetical protein
VSHYYKRSPVFSVSYLSGPVPLMHGLLRRVRPTRVASYLKFVFNFILNFVWWISFEFFSISIEFYFQCRFQFCFQFHLMNFVWFFFNFVFNVIFNFVSISCEFCSQSHFEFCFQIHLDFIFNVVFNFICWILFDFFTFVWILFSMSFSNSFESLLLFLILFDEFCFQYNHSTTYVIRRTKN